MHCIRSSDRSQKGSLEEIERVSPRQETWQLHSLSLFSRSEKNPSFFVHESHILLHCPGLADLRSAHSHLFAEQQQSLATLFEQPPSRVATYIRAALLQHANMLGITGGTFGPK